MSILAVREAPPYPVGRDILKGKTVLAAASVGTGIGNAIVFQASDYASYMTARRYR